MTSWYICSMRMGSDRSAHSEELLRLAHRRHQLVDLVEGVVDREGGPRGGGHAEAAHQRPRAVVPDADRHTLAVEDLAHVVGVDADHHERHRATALDVLGGADDPHTLDGAQAL